MFSSSFFTSNFSFFSSISSSSCFFSSSFSYFSSIFSSSCSFSPSFISSTTSLTSSTKYSSTATRSSSTIGNRRISSTSTAPSLSISFFLDKHSGKKCFMIAPRELISLDSDDVFSWQWGEHPDSSIKFVSYESETDTENQANTVHLPRLQESGDIPKMRGDGLMEVKLGYINSKKGTDGPFEARFFEMNHIYKGGLIVEGLEFLPK
ncbi:hypothetical protein R3W88_011715 [Solanum pinnatisectum]|uniref:Uncharacterized protein n=1 Tax=Solanum pinnatisectum TaxID=50273 RepID=A0AAV9LAU1_9SOLN|nr:hypothetical protein R3W88_011715 [Solanum pinnatisectum]